jgi:ADP-ribosylglycohydrolase
MSLPPDYLERTYAGVLGKIIGVYLGRPFEQWTHERIVQELGEITYYVHERLGLPLIVTDDDLSGTFTFLRALPDNGNRRDLSAEQIGQAWLNYIIEQRTILWWGGMGNSTEHTAYLRLRQGIPAPRSGSIVLNTKTVAEQIGAQIFIDGWAMVAPNDPELAVELAGKAASVSHDGEAVYGAQVIAAMESLAYAERDLNTLIDTAVTFIPAQSTIRRLIDDVREWHSEFRDWHDARQKIAEHYGYDKFGGNCHIVPNHALIHLALLYGGDDFQKALMIVNTSGWDTDCNSGNVGCLLGIKNGLAGMEGSPDWRTPIADRLYVSTAEGGGAITDAVAQTERIVNIGRALAGLPTLYFKAGSRFHFELPGAVQGFTAETPEVMTIENVEGHSQAGTRSLALRYHNLAPGQRARVATPTFIPPEAIQMIGYKLEAAPTLYAGQTVHAALKADHANQGTVKWTLYIQVYGAHDQLVIIHSPQMQLLAGQYTEISWQIPDTDGAPIARLGVEVSIENQSTKGAVYLDYLTWDGEPHSTFCRPQDGGTMWRRAWVNGVDSYEPYWTEAFRLIQNRGTGLLMTGTRDWKDYRVKAAIKPHMIENGGIAARVQGLRRYYALLLTHDKKARLVKMCHHQIMLAETEFVWQAEHEYGMQLEVRDNHITARIDGRLLFAVEDHAQPLCDGGIALVVTEGRLVTESVSVAPLD